MEKTARRGGWFLSVGIVCLVIVICWWWFCHGQTTVLLVRHADRDNGVDQLNTAGATRAQEFVHVVEKAAVTAIYQTQAVRTQQTAQLLATRLGLTPIQNPAADVQAVVDDIFAHHRGETVLVVGHSDTVPQIIAALGGPPLPNIQDTEFDNLFVLSNCHCRRAAKVVNLQYGAVSP